MDALECLHSRHSVRQYTDEAVSDAEIKTMLDAAMIAPSAGNAQPWHFVVVRDRAMLNKVPAIHPYAGMAAHAPLGILVCGKLDEEKYPGFWVQDCSAATQNLLLAANALGLGAVWTGIYPVEERVAAFKKLFGLPESAVPLAFLVIGRPESAGQRRSRYSEAKVHLDKWQASRR